MASPSHQRRVRESNFTNIGVAGRKTGLSIQDTGQRDDDGMEDLDNFFSPEKAAPPPRNVNGRANSSNGATSPVTAVSKFESTTMEHTATEATMQIASSSGIEPTEALTGRRQLSLPPTISRSPVRFTVSGTPRRGSSIGPKSSPTRQFDSSPIRPSSPARRLDFGRSRRSSSALLGSPIRKTTPKPNGNAPVVGTKKPEAASLPFEPVLEAPKEPAKQPVVARKKQMLLVEKAIVEEDTRSLQEAEAPSSPPMLPVPKKKPTKRGLLSGKSAASKTFDFDDEETEDEAETGAEDTTKDTVDEVVSRMLDDTIELDLASTQEDVDMIDAQEVTRVLAEVEGITQMDDTGEPEPAPTKTKKAAKPHKVLTPEPAPAPVVQKKAGKSRKAATPEPQSEAEEGDEDELEEFDPTLLKKRRKQALIKKPAPTKAKKAAPEPKSTSADNENDEEGENVQPKKRAGKQPPAKKAAAKKALETESETEQEEEEDGLESRVLSKRGGKQVSKKIALGKKSAPAKGKKAQQPEPESESEAEPEPQPEEGDDTEGEEEESVPVPKKRGGKQAPAKKPTAAKSARVTKKAPEPEPEPEPESEVDADETEVEEVEEPIQPRKRGGKQTQPEKAKPKQPAKPARKNAKKATSPIPEEPAPEPEPEKPVVKGKGRGKGKAVAPLSPPTKKKSVKTSKIAADDDVEMGEASGTSQTNKKSVPVLPKGRRKKVPQVEDVTEPVLQEAEGEEGDVEEPPKKKSRGAAKPKTTRLVKSIVSSQAPRSATKRPAKAPKSRKPPPSQEAEPAEDVQEDEAEEEAPRSRKGKAPATKKPAAKKPTATEKGKGKAREESTSLSEEIKGTQRVILEKLPAPPPRDESVDAEGKRRSNRRRLAPLQYWKGEKVEYRIEAEGEEAAPRPEMVVIRVESDEDKKKTKRAARKRTGSAAPAAAGKKRKRTISKDEADEGESDPGEPEPWEQGIGLSEDDVGIKRGMIRSFPPYADSEGEDILEECHLAYTKERIVTVDVANGAFKFVKTFTQDGFGTGIIEVPPGGGKRVKNSGKMTLVFYMLLGRATVTIGDNRFRVGKGGQFMVPRGNLYSIENEFDSDAKMFFAQGRDMQSEQVTEEAADD